MTNYKKMAEDAKKRNPVLLEEMITLDDSAAASPQGEDGLAGAQKSKGATKQAQQPKQKVDLFVPCKDTKTVRKSFMLTEDMYSRLKKVQEKHGYRNESATLTGILEWFFRQDGV